MAAKKNEINGIPLSCEKPGDERFVMTGKSITLIRPANSKRKGTKSTGAKATPKKGGK